MSTRTFAVFCDESLPVLPNITNTVGALAPAAPRPVKLKKAATLPAVLFGDEKENVNPRTGLSTTSSFANAAPAAAERPAKKRRTALATTQVRGKPVLARSRSALDAGKKQSKAPRAPSSPITPAVAPIAEFTFSSPLPSPAGSPTRNTSSPKPAVAADDVQAFVDGLFADADMELEPTARSPVTCPAPGIAASAPADA